MFDGPSLTVSTTTSVVRGLISSICADEVAWECVRSSTLDSRSFWPGSADPRFRHAESGSPFRRAFGYSLGGVFRFILSFPALRFKDNILQVRTAAIADVVLPDFHKYGRPEITDRSFAANTTPRIFSSEVNPRDVGTQKEMRMSSTLQRPQEI